MRTTKSNCHYSNNRIIFNSTNVSYNTNLSSMSSKSGNAICLSMIGVYDLLSREIPCTTRGKVNRCYNTRLVPLNDSTTHIVMWESSNSKEYFKSIISWGIKNVKSNYISCFKNVGVNTSLNCTSRNILQSRRSDTNINFSFSTITNRNNRIRVFSEGKSTNTISYLNTSNQQMSRLISTRTDIVTTINTKGSNTSNIVVSKFIDISYCR